MKRLETAAVLGSGAVGSALLEELPRSGVKVLAAWTQSSGLAPPPLTDVDVVLLAVSDSAIAPLAARLEVGPSQLVVHLAGALGLDVLKGGRKKGARVGSIHPLRAFVRGRRQDFHGAAAGVSGSDASAREQLKQLARALGMMPLETTDRARALYHAAAVLAAGSQVAVFAEAMRAFRKATGASEPAARAALLPLALNALEKLKGQTAPEALTGPAARGDFATIAAHRKMLPKDLLPLYDHLTNVMLQLSEDARRKRPRNRP
ncbi:MAG: DUF2520 domain-containing protein [Myxococcales bacterium]|nr:DUF2520 domain-containing protein [Myxococcales bacterium]